MGAFAAKRDILNRKISGFAGAGTRDEVIVVSSLNLDGIHV